MEPLHSSIENITAIDNNHPQPHRPSIVSNFLNTSTDACSSIRSESICSEIVRIEAKSAAGDDGSDIGATADSDLVTKVKTSPDGNAFEKLAKQLRVSAP